MTTDSLVSKRKSKFVFDKNKMTVKVFFMFLRILNIKKPTIKLDLNE